MQEYTSAAGYSVSADDSMFYPPAPTRNDVGNGYRCFVSPEAIEIVPTGLLPMSPSLERESPY